MTATAAKQEATPTATEAPEADVNPTPEAAEATDNQTANPRENVQVGAPRGYRKVIALAIHVPEGANVEHDAKMADELASLLHEQISRYGFAKLHGEQLKHHFIATFETEASAAAKAVSKSIKAPKAPKELTGDDGGLLFRKVEKRVKELAKLEPNTTMGDRRKRAREEVAAAHGITVERMKELISEFLGV